MRFNRKMSLPNGQHLHELHTKHSSFAQPVLCERNQPQPPNKRRWPLFFPHVPVYLGVPHKAFVLVECIKTCHKKRKGELNPSLSCRNSLQHGVQQMVRSQPVAKGRENGINNDFSCLNISALERNGSTVHGYGSWQTSFIIVSESHSPNRRIRRNSGQYANTSE